MPQRDVVIIGASAGGIPALRLLLAGLPAGLPASVLVVVHTRAGTAVRLPDVLARFGPLPAAYAVSGQRLTPGLVTVAPPGQHLVITAGEVLRLHRGPLVHSTRPAIDPLLRSAADVCGNRVTAVVLSGLQRDGANGAAAVSAAGGSVLVQDPADAGSPAMPRAALDRVPGAAVWPASKLGRAVAEQVAAPAPSTVAPQFPLLASRALTRRCGWRCCNFRYTPPPSNASSSESTPAVPSLPRPPGPAPPERCTPPI